MLNHLIKRAGRGDKAVSQNDLARLIEDDEIECENRVTNSTYEVLNEIAKSPQHNRPIMR